MGNPLDQPLIRAITFREDASITIEYCVPSADARVNGIILNHVILIPVRSDYDNEIDALIEASTALLNDALEDLPDLEPLRPPSETDDDDDDDDDG